MPAFNSDADAYEATLSCYQCESGNCICNGMHGCDKPTGRRCDTYCIEECYDDTDCCRCGCNCQSPSECYNRSVDKEHECRCEEIIGEMEDLHWDRAFDYARD